MLPNGTVVTREDRPMGYTSSDGLRSVKHSYEEIRNAALDVLAGREKVSVELHSYSALAHGVAEVLDRRSSGAERDGSRQPHLSEADRDLFIEVFWDLFRQGILTLGYNDSNNGFPWCRVSHYGKILLTDPQAYFFYDVSTYAAAIRKQVADINDTTLLYLQEAMQAFRAGCMLSAAVMIGVATEHTFQLLMDVIDKNQTEGPKYKSVGKEQAILRKVNKFKSIIEKDLPNIPYPIREDFDTHFAGILAVIRNYRNDSGHPSGRLVGREQTYVLLNLVIPYLKKMYELMVHFA
jgi:hypothetical protein